MDFHQNTQPETNNDNQNNINNTPDGNQSQPQNQQPYGNGIQNQPQNQQPYGNGVQNQPQNQQPYGNTPQAPYQNQQPYGNDGRYPYRNNANTPYQNGNPYQGNAPYGNAGYNNGAYPGYNRSAYGMPVSEPGSSLATAAMILGILSIISCFTFTVYPPFIMGSIAIVLALLSKGRRPKLLSKAKSGMICGVIGLVSNIILVIGCIVLVFTNSEFKEQLNQTFMEQYGQTFDEMWEEILEDSDY